jgi:hypothetical protein
MFIKVSADAKAQAIARPELRAVPGTTARMVSVDSKDATVIEDATVHAAGTWEDGMVAVYRLKAAGRIPSEPMMGVPVAERSDAISIPSATRIGPLKCDLLM